MRLQVHPALGIRAKNLANRRAMSAVIERLPTTISPMAPLGHADGLGQTVLGNAAHGFQEILQQDFTGMYGKHVSFHVAHH